MIAKNHSKQGSITIQSFYSDHLNFFIQMLAVWAKISGWMKDNAGAGASTKLSVPCASRMF